MYEKNRARRNEIEKTFEGVQLQYPNIWNKIQDEILKAENRWNKFLDYISK